MKCHDVTVLLGLMLLPALAAEKPRAMFGVVPEPAVADGADGLLVRAMHPASPARVAGVQVGDVILSLNGHRVTSREEMRAILRKLAPGDVLQVDVFQAGVRRTLSVTMIERPVRKESAAADSPDAAVGGDRKLRPLAVSPEIRKAMREHRLAVVAQLAALPNGFVPMEVSDHLQAIRHLARDANPRGKGWMPGEAGEVTLQFRDAEGLLVLQGASNMLTLTVFDKDAVVRHTLPLNTPEERAAVPQEIIGRLQRLR